MADRVSSRPRAAPASPCVVVEAADAIFTLYPPIPFAIEEVKAVYKLVLPFGLAATDIAVGDGKCIRRHLRPGDLLLTQPGSSLTMRHVEPFEFLFACLDADGVRAAAEAAAGDKWQMRDHVPWHDPAVAALGREMRRVMIAEALPPPSYLATLAYALIARVSLVAASEAGRSQRDLIAPVALARVVRHVEARLTEPIEVAELADVAGLSTAHFSRVFTSATGDTPHRFVMKRRVCRARGMLAAHDASLAEIAVRSGFSNQSHLSTAFAREVGLSPARYRAAFRNDTGGAHDPSFERRNRTVR